MNKLNIIGNLTRDPELYETADGTRVVRFGIAVNRRPNKDGERLTDFFNCVAWEGRAESIYKHMKKGNKMFVSGEINFDRYTDEDGVVHMNTQVTVSDFEFLTPKSQEEKKEEVEQPKPKKGLKKVDDDIPF